MWNSAHRDSNSNKKQSVVQFKDGAKRLGSWNPSNNEVSAWSPRNNREYLIGIEDTERKARALVDRYWKNLEGK